MEILKQSLLATQKKKNNSLKEEEDLCPVCNFNLYFNERVTQRIGLIDKKDKVLGWLCPNCMSEFDLKNNIVELFGDKILKGEA